MNKNRIDKFLLPAYGLLKDSGVANENNEIKKTFRGYISSFGAAVIMGSLKSAIAFFSAQGSADEPREKLMRIICALVEEKKYDETEKNSLMEYVNGFKTEREVRENIYNAAVAVKLAMNMYTLTRENK